MEWINEATEFLVHFDRHIDALVHSLGGWTYAALFGLIFVETGILFAPFLPGDSVIFVAGATAARGTLNVHMLFLVLALAAVLGDSTNYGLGRLLGPRIMTGGDDSRFFKRAHLVTTRAYFDKFGGSTLVIARFVPVIRMLAPLVAGAAAMPYATFLLFNTLGGVVWVAVCTYGAFWFGSIQAVQDNFLLVILGVIAVSVVPAGVELLRQSRRAAAERKHKIESSTHAERELLRKGPVESRSV